MKLQQLTIQVETPKEGLPWLKKFYDVIRDVYEKLATAFNGRIGFGDGTVPDNIDGVWVLALTVAGNFTITHNLGRIPAGWFMVKKDGFEDVKFISSTKTQLTLAGQNGGVNATFFII